MYFICRCSTFSSFGSTNFHFFTFEIFFFRSEERYSYSKNLVFSNQTGNYKISLQQTSSWFCVEPQRLMEKVKMDQQHLII